jgi:dUTP pyrophosphatase
MRVYFKKLNECAQVPTKKPGNAGYDLFYAGEDRELYPTQRALLDTAVAIELPEWAYARIADRSGMALKQGLHVLGGVIDSNYRGAIGVILINLGDTKVEIKKGDRIAQMIIEQAHEAKFIEVSDLTNTERGITGYGASGR